MAYSKTLHIYTLITVCYAAKRRYPTEEHKVAIAIFKKKLHNARHLAVHIISVRADWMRVVHSDLRSHALIFILIQPCCFHPHDCSSAGILGSILVEYYLPRCTQHAKDAIPRKPCWNGHLEA